MYDLPDSSAIFDIFEVGLANSHILVTNHLDTPKLAIFEQWRQVCKYKANRFGEYLV